MTIYIWDQNLQRCFKALKRTQNTFQISLWTPYMYTPNREEDSSTKKNKNKTEKKKKKVVAEALEVMKWGL